jgi:hypothetical protein
VSSCADTVHDEEGSECEGMHEQIDGLTESRKGMVCPARQTWREVRSEEKFAPGAASWAGTEL